MTQFDKEYYVVFPQITADVPRVTVSSDLEVNLALKIKHPLNEISFIEFEFREPYPKKPKIVDYFTNGGFGTISEKLNQVLEPLNIKGIQLIPATVDNPKSREIYKNYYFLHIYNYLNCLDMDKSNYTKSLIGTIRVIEKIVLDTAVLSKIPLEDRLIFRLGELYTFSLFHQSVVEKIMAVNPEGLRFVKVEDFNEGSAFD